MENQLAGFYGELAQQLDSMVPMEWDKIYYLGEVEKGKLSWGSIFYFVDSKTKEISLSSELVMKFSIPRQEYKKALTELKNIMLKIYDCFEENSQDLWEQLIFILENDGTFKVDFKYDVMSPDDGGHVEREVAWAYNTFDYVPDEGHSRDILNRYLAKQNK